MKPAVIVCLLMMFAFLIMVTETDGKPADEYEYVAGSKPVYMKKLQSVSRSLDQVLSIRKCCCPECTRKCTCCCA